MFHDTKKRFHIFQKYIRGNFKPVNHKALVIEGAKTVYIPIPKAANSSITLALYPTLNLATPPLQVMRQDKNLLYRPVVEALQLAEPDWFIFSVVRDPISRSKSAYRNKVLMDDPIFRPCATMGILPTDDFETFVEKCSKWPRGYLNDHFQPQSVLLSRALKDHRFHLYKFETLKRDWNVICDQIESRSATRPDKLPHENSSSHIPIKVSERALDIACRFYRKDFQVFGYQSWN